MVFILKVNKIQEKKFEPHCLRASVQFLINTVKIEETQMQTESKIMQISQIMKNRDWLINVTCNRNIDQNQSGACIGKHAYLILSFFFCS